MRKKKIEVMSATCVYPEHVLKPCDFLDFIIEDGFDDDWKDCGLNLEEDLCCLQLELCAMPSRGVVIAGTGGLRKLRWALPGRGRSGGARIIYLWIPEISFIHLYMAYPKSVRDDLSPRMLREISQDVAVTRGRLIEIYGGV